MKTIEFSKTFIALILVMIMAFSSGVRAQDEADEAVQLDTSETISASDDSVDHELVANVDEASADRRSEIIQEAVDALAETKAALGALDENRIDDALDALAMVTGKLQIIVAREPSLALAPTDVRYSSHALYSDRVSIEAAIEDARDALDDGRIQVARNILEVLADEIVLEVSHLPLATYPAAIAAIVPLIDEGKMDEAKNALQAALNTQVVREYVFPMPVAKAGHYLELAEQLAEVADRSDEDNAALAEHLASAREQLELSELLGYGNNDVYPDLYAQLDDIEEKVGDGLSGIGFFDRLRKSMNEAAEES